ncbi:helix-turn-helix domain-containing protein [Sinorhizobium chiapasense]|uniref:AraC family transcriptional regulator n=1 Tax=Sinorhizobium chiapasense TaxID=501572 RepID=A0ABZ2BA22_9HYPH
MAAKQSEILVSLVEAGVQGFRGADAPPAKGFVAAVPLPNREQAGAAGSVVGQEQSGIYIAVSDDLPRVSSVCCQGLRYLLFYFPTAALQVIALECGYDFTSDLGSAPFVRTSDDTFYRLASALEVAFAQTQETAKLFVDSVTRAAAVHLVASFGRKRDVTASKGGLAPWQVKRAREMLEANLQRSVPFSQIAAECRLSARHFSRAFSQSMGMPPQRWLIKHRVETAKRLLRNPDLSLPAVAKEAGFADQSHLTRVFSEWVGESPGSWRRSNMEAPAPHGEAG